MILKEHPLSACAACLVPHPALSDLQPLLDLLSSHTCMCAQKKVIILKLLLWQRRETITERDSPSSILLSISLV